MAEKRVGGIFDVSSRLHQELGFEWRPIQKSSLLNSLYKNLKNCRTFIRHAVKAKLVSFEDMVCIFYDHVPSVAASIPSIVASQSSSPYDDEDGESGSSSPTVISPGRRAPLVVNATNIMTRARSTSNPNISAAPHYTALISPETKEVYLQIPSNHELLSIRSLTGFLDICTEFGCEKVYAIVRKDSQDLNKIIRTMMEMDFEFVSPSIKSMPGYIFLGYEL